jgi:hypothetical protein
MLAVFLLTMVAAIIFGNLPQKSDRFNSLHHQKTIRFDSSINAIILALTSIDSFTSG